MKASFFQPLMDLVVLECTDIVVDLVPNGEATHIMLSHSFGSGRCRRGHNDQKARSYRHSVINGQYKHSPAAACQAGRDRVSAEGETYTVTYTVSHL